jgi:hypothetical protein
LGLFGGLRHAKTAGFGDEGHHVLDASAAAHIGEQDAAAPCGFRIPLHDIKIGTDMGREIHLVDHQQIRPGYGRAALARDFLALAHGDHVDRQVGQIGREGGGEIVAAGLNEDDVQVRVTLVERIDGAQIERGILADRRVRTAAGLNPMTRSDGSACMRTSASASSRV